MKTILFSTAFILISVLGYSACKPKGNETTYGTDNVWRGYVYDGTNFKTYKGYVTEGSRSDPDFDESFGGSDEDYNTNGCPVETETFSVRYKLKQSFDEGDYSIVVGGDDGYRLSLDGGSTWTIDSWELQTYTTTTKTVHLDGNTNMVLEYYENDGDNRISFKITKKACSASGNPATYGTDNKWIGYVYSGTDFDNYKGYVNEGSTASANFDEDFGGDEVTFATNGCSVITTQFSARFRLKTYFTKGKYTITVGADDGYRLSLDGGHSYVIDQWNDQSYSTTTYTATLNGNYNLVLEYYENAVSNRITYNISGGSVLPVTFSGFDATYKSNQVDLVWTTMMEKGIDHYDVERSADGLDFSQIASQPSKTTISTNAYQLAYNFTDEHPLSGISYYRIRVVGKDNYINESKIVQVNIINQVQGVKIYPTLVQNNTVYVQTDKTVRNARMEFFNISGKKISETTWNSLNGRQHCTLSNAYRLPAGTYVARLTADGQPVKSQLLIVQNN